MLKRDTANSLIRAGLLAMLLVAGCSGEPAAQPVSDSDETAPQNEAAHQGEAGEGTHQEGQSSAGEQSNEVHLSAEQRELLSIEVDEAPAGTAEAQITASADVRFDPDLTSRVGPRLPANVVEVLVDLGERVEPGQPLVRMDSIELGRAKADYLVAEARASSARQRFEREQTLAEQQITSQAELIEARSQLQQARANHRAATETLKLYGLSQEAIDGIESSEEPLSRFTLTAAAGGIVQQRDLAPGESVSPDQAPVHIVDTSRVWLMIEAFEKALPGLAEGQRVTFTSRALPGETFTGTIDWISKKLNEQSRTLSVRAVLDNAGGQLRAGMTGTATVHTQSGQDAWALVPVDALQRMNGQDVVFVPGHAEGAYVRTPVTVGEEGGGWAEIRQGLEPGDRIVVRGAFDLMSAMTSGTRSAAHTH